jgi:hypothetical protein
MEKIAYRNKNTKLRSLYSSNQKGVWTGHSERIGELRKTRKLFKMAAFWDIAPCSVVEVSSTLNKLMTMSAECNYLK